MPTGRKYPQQLVDRGVRPVFEPGGPIAEGAADRGCGRGGAMGLCLGPLDHAFEARWPSARVRGWLSFAGADTVPMNQRRGEGSRHAVSLCGLGRGL
jgi:hypothetical protein